MSFHSELNVGVFTILCAEHQQRATGVDGRELAQHLRHLFERLSAGYKHEQISHARAQHRSVFAFLAIAGSLLPQLRELPFDNLDIQSLT